MYIIYHIYLDINIYIYTYAYKYIYLYILYIDIYYIYIYIIYICIYLVALPDFTQLDSVVKPMTCCFVHNQPDCSILKPVIFMN